MRHSVEQKRIIEISQDSTNCIVDAVAGSGKTTTLMGIAEAQPTKRIIAVLYNRSLKDETQARIVKNNIANLEVQTYHALARKYYSSNVINDSGIKDILERNLPPFKQFPKWKRLVIDEVQDMNPLYFHLILKFITDFQDPELRVTVMGDRFQSIYNYMGADPRFLTLADKLYMPKIRGEWVNTTLSTTYRCSPKICSFINKGLLGYERMIPANPEKHSAPVHYIYGSPFDAKDVLIHHIKTLLQSGYKYGDFFILSTSVKVKGRDTPVKVLENALVTNGIPVYVPNEDEKSATTASENPASEKIVITTFHQSKGLERKIVIMFNFDDSYFDNKDFDRNFLASPLYVSLTRAQEYLFVVHDSKFPPLKFYNPYNDSVIYISTNGRQISAPLTNQKQKDEKMRLRVFNATDLTDYLSANAINEAQKYIRTYTIKHPHIKLKFPSLVNTGSNSFENISDINSIAIPAYYEWQTRNTMRILNADSIESSAFCKRYLELADKLEKTKSINMAEILESSNMFLSLQSGYHYKVAQIKTYAWLTETDIQPCIEILSQNIVENDVQYERCLDEQIINNATLRGQIDAYSEKQTTLWEIKCTEALDATHEIQLGIYAWLLGKMYPKRFSEIRYHLLNIKTGELRHVQSTMSELNNMITFLISEKIRPCQKYTDDEFISKFTEKFEPTNQTYESVKMQPMIQNTVMQPLFIDEPQSATSNISTSTNISTNTNATQEKKGMVIVFDLETNGLPETPSFGKYYPPSEIQYYNSSRIVQWSWALYEHDGTLISEEDHIIKPNPKEYRILNQQFHNISESTARVQGKEFDTVLSLWNSYISRATTVVGHNVQFDKHVLLSELHRRNHPDAIAELLNKEWICTMERAKELVGLKARNKLKPPKLRELMHALGINEEAGRSFHNSKHDVYYTGKCYFNEQKLINSCPKMYEGKHAGKTYEEILIQDREYAVHTNAVCNIRRLYNSPLRPFSNWVKLRAKSDPLLKSEIEKKEKELLEMVQNT